MQRKHLGNHEVLLTLAVLLLTAAGCAVGPTSESQARADREVFELKAIGPERAAELLAELELGEVAVLGEGNAIAVTGSADVREKAAVVVDLVDSPLPYTIEVLATVAQARKLPANEQFAAVLGTAAIGTFGDPPPWGRASRAIIDIHNEAVVAIAPVPLARDIVTLAQFGPTALLPTEPETIPSVTPSETVEAVPEASEEAFATEPQDEDSEPDASTVAAEDVPQEIIAASMFPPDEPEFAAIAPEPEIPTDVDEPAVIQAATVIEDEAPEPIAAEPAVVSGIVWPASMPEPIRAVQTYELEPLINGDDVLQLDLPDRLEMVQLLDLVAEYLGLDYLCDPEKLRGETVSLRLHGKLQGEIQVKELYPLLESVLKFKGLAMTRHEGNLVTILPVDDALAADPTLLDSDSNTLGAGDLVVTRAFVLQHVTTASATTLLESMKLSVAVSPVSETRTLIVTCYAHRMERIERLLNMVDRPGRPREFRYRQLKYTLAGPLVAQVEALVAELQTAPVKIAPIETPAAAPASPILLTGGTAKSSSGSLSNANRAANEEAERDTVYLNADERTNRLLMIGQPEQLAIVEEVISALDVAQHDPRTLRVYPIVHLRAADVVDKLATLGVIGKAATPAPTATPAALTNRITGTDTGAAPAATAMIEATQITVLESTNSLLINGTAEQHVRIRDVVDHIDVAPQDLRYLDVYDIKYVDAEAMRQKLIEFEVIGDEEDGPVAEAAESREDTGAIVEAEVATLQRPQVTVRESTNSLLVNATTMQHARIADIIAHIDVVQQDLRVMREYPIEFVDASEVRAKLEEFELIGAASQTSGATTAAAPGTGATAEAASAQQPQVAVLESTNSLLINATEFQHVQMAAVIEHVDKEVRQEAIPYEIYFLESQDPETLAGVLERLIQERTVNADDKISAPTQRPQDAITVVPDPKTFSLVVNASRKNQDWIGKLIRSLDRRRPQVLIDVTLVEITETDQFTYDLDLIASSPDLRGTSAISGVDPNSNALGRLFQTGSGLFTGFYGDRHIRALLETVQAKNYGRVLAKPKILVNDNEPGVIKTTDTTYVERRSSVPVTSGGTGSQQNLIETALDYTAYEAGITLNITPHISEGQLLRLDISLVRSDFLPTESQTRPPNTTASEVTTAVTVPDGSTIILGGLLKLNQNKGGTRVPVLGDVPLIGPLFRSANNTDTQSKLYVFVKAEIIRPTDGLLEGMSGLELISQRNRAAFEAHEAQFQAYQTWPGVDPQPVEPTRVLDAR